jgi:hypothetical protein
VIVYKHKKNYHKKQGHRQDYTYLRIDKITAKAKADAKPKAEAEPKPKTEAKAKPKVKAKAEESTDGA